MRPNLCIKCWVDTLFMGRGTASRHWAWLCDLSFKEPESRYIMIWPNDTMAGVLSCWGALCVNHQKSCWVRCVSSTIEIDVKLFVSICAILYGTCAMSDFADISLYTF